jgi:hypothetical protein
MLAGHDLLAMSGAAVPHALGAVASVGRFTVLRLLGAGGMGLVVLARDPDKPEGSPDSLVAVKVIRPELRNSALAVRRFIKEANHMARLDHPHILRVLETNADHDPAFYVMPYLDKGPLSRHIDPDAGLPRERILEIMVPVARAIAFAHERGIIHRDLKPANIMLADDESPLVCDFGLVRTVYNDSIVDPNRTIHEGSAAYMSPAIAEGLAEDTRCDIYAFGATLYELLTGRPPYDGLTPMEVMRKIRAGPPEPVASVKPEADACLAHIASRCMARKLADRYASMNDVVQDLERCEKRERIVSRPRMSRRRFLAATTVTGIAAGAAWWGIYRPPQRRSLRVLAEMEFPIEDFAYGSGTFTRDGARVALQRHAPRRIEIVDIDSLQSVGPAMLLGTRAVAWYLDFSQGSDRLAVVSDIDDPGFRLFDVASGQQLRSGNPRHLAPVVFGSGHRAFVVGIADREEVVGHVVDIDTFEPWYAIRRVDDQTGIWFANRANNHGVNFIDRQGRLYYARADQTIMYSASREMRLAVVAQSDGRPPVTADEQARIQLWEGDRVARIFEGHDIPEVRTDANLIRPVPWLHELDAQRYILSHGQDGTIRCWESETGRQLWLIRPDAGQRAFGSFSFTGRRLLTTNRSGTMIRVVELPTPT